jgi:exosortase
MLAEGHLPQILSSARLYKSLSHAAQTVPSEIASKPPSSDRIPRWQIVVLGAALLWLYAPVLSHLAGQWIHDPNYSHGFFVPAFSLYVLWQERDRLRALPLRPSWSGLLILLLAVVVLTAGVLGAELFLSRVSLLIAIAGVVILMYGWNHMRAAMFPWLFLLLMIPIPNIVFNQITFPLQLLASKVAAVTLPLFGVPVLREGNVIQLPVMALEVAEACSGIRSLMSLTTLAIIYGYLLETRLSVRVVLALASIPIAVIANSLRIVGTGLLVQYWDPEKAEGFFHLFSGWLIFVVSLSLLFLLHRALQRFWPQEGSR